MRERGTRHALLIHERIHFRLAPGLHEMRPSGRIFGLAQSGRGVGRVQIKLQRDLAAVQDRSARQRTRHQPVLFCNMQRPIQPRRMTVLRHLPQETAVR